MLCSDQQILLFMDASSEQQCPTIPSSWRRKEFEAVHNLLHPSIRATGTLITRKFILGHDINKQVGAWAKACIFVKPLRYIAT